MDRLIAGSSLVPNSPVLSSSVLPWAASLTANWEQIRAEACGVLDNPAAVPPLDQISPDHRRIAPPGKWRSFFLRGYGHDIPSNLKRCPETASALLDVPGLNTAFFSILAPGARILPHRGVTKGLVTVHLGLVVPEGDVRMRVGGEVVGWSEGELLVFDDTWRHEVWNESGEARVVLLMQVERPLAQPGRWIARAFLWAVRRSSFVRDARAGIQAWDDAVGHGDHPCA